MRRNRGVIYTGRVGSKWRPRPKRASRRIFKHIVCLEGGPYDACKVQLSKFCDGCTLPIVVRGQAGRYVRGAWVSA